MAARAVMVLGTTSGAGKSWLATALCRWYARQGLKVAPFKAQNMSNNARVVPGVEGELGEIGSAQYFQALAARATPDVRMNPVLLKPEHDTASQVVVMGQVRRDYSTMPWRSRSEVLWPHAQTALQSLMAEHEVVVIEGAGSPAEINLHDSDFVNMRTALAAQAACLLVTDIDRGGAFAHLYGTYQLLPMHEQALLRGFVLNRFRGDAALLAPGPDQLEALTGVPTLAVLPMWRGHGLPEEDGLLDEAWSVPQVDEPACAAPAAAPRRIAIVAYPRISNLDEFQPLRNLPGVRLVWARAPRDLDGADWVILPGSKHTRADLAWLHEQGLSAAIAAHAQAGRPVLGICGGLQMLGEWVQDPLGVEGTLLGAQPGTSAQADPALLATHGAGPVVGLAANQGAAVSHRTAGLGLLPLQTTFAATKSLKRVKASWQPGEDGALLNLADPAQARALHVGASPWHALQGLRVDAYEIHQGQSVWADPTNTPAATVCDASGHIMGWQQGAVLGVYAHGLFEAAPVMQALFGQHVRSLDAVFDGLADFIDQHFAPGVLMDLLKD